MLYIGICDDEKYFLSEEKEIIIKYMKNQLLFYLIILNFRVY